jgi:hypothetical protein
VVMRPSALQHVLGTPHIKATVLVRSRSIEVELGIELERCTTEPKIGAFFLKEACDHRFDVAVGDHEK